jgi:hypothetical protein
MGFPTLLLCLVSAQDPQPAPPRALDLVELKSGEVLEGVVTVQLDTYVEIELGAGATVGMSMAQVAAVRRGAGNPVTAPPVVPLLARDEWFLLHDDQGAQVGWLHGTVTPEASGGVRLLEEWEFTTGSKRFAVTVLEHADAGLQAISSYFRERVTETIGGAAAGDPLSRRDRTTEERIVEATRGPDTIEVVRMTRAGRRERSLPAPAGVTFPLLARELGRRAFGTGAQRLVVYDPATEELAERSYEAGRVRTVVLDGTRTSITEVAETSASGRNAQWLDASLHTVRREIAGPTLVAIPSPGGAPPSAAAVPANFGKALVADPDNRFGLWLPNPAWAAAEPAAGQVLLQCPAHGARISLSSVEHLESGTLLPTAADVVARWFVLLHPELQVAAREPARVRDCEAVRLDLQPRNSGVAQRATVHVIATDAGFLVLAFVAPLAAWDELAADFAFALRSVEVDGPAMAPRLQGPLLDGAPAGSAPLPKPPVAGAAVPPRELPHVRVPMGGQR